MPAGMLATPQGADALSADRIDSHPAMTSSALPTRATPMGQATSVTSAAGRPTSFADERPPITRDALPTRPIDLVAEALAQTEPHEPEAQAAGSRAAARPSKMNRLPVRVHIECDAQRATVWLGVDAAARAALPAVTEAIGRWLAQTGYGVPTFVCNGQVLNDKTDPEFPLADDLARKHAPATPIFAIEPNTGESS